MSASIPPNHRCGLREAGERGEEQLYALVRATLQAVKGGSDLEYLALKTSAERSKSAPTNCRPKHPIWGRLGM